MEMQSQQLKRAANRPRGYFDIGNGIIEQVLDSVRHGSGREGEQLLDTVSDVEMDSWVNC